MFHVKHLEFYRAMRSCGAAITASPFAEFRRRQQIVAVASRLHTVTVAMCGLCPRATAWRFMVYRHFS